MKASLKYSVSLLFCILTFPAFAQEKHLPLKIGIIADVHKDLMHDADLRLTSFISEMKQLYPDFIIQLGDFCQPKEHNRAFLSIWDTYPGRRLHVVGNHDTDGGFTKDSTLAFLGSPASYFSFDLKGFHFIILDGNEVNPSPDKTPGYPRFIGKEQLIWLRLDLAMSHFPTIVFSHQPLLTGLDNSADVFSLLKSSGSLNPKGKVIACFNGHDHANQAKLVDGIWFIEINSMSYDWLGEAFAHKSYPDSIHQKYPYIQYTAPYRDPLWAVVEFDSKGEIRITGRKSDFVGPSPQDLNHPGKGYGLSFSASIMDTVLTFK
jgi:predicted phosphodiesterase